MVACFEMGKLFKTHSLKTSGLGKLYETCEGGDMGQVLATDAHFVDNCRVNGFGDDGYGDQKPSDIGDDPLVHQPFLKT